MIRFSVSPRIWLRSGLTALALGLVFFASPVGAAPQISRGTWIESQGDSCGGTYICRVTFAAVPAGKTLIARNVACRIIAPFQSSTSTLFLGGNSRLTYLATGPSGQDGPGGKKFQFNTEIFTPFIAGQRPQVVYSIFQNGSPLALDCTLAGELRPSDLPI